MLLRVLTGAFLVSLIAGISPARADLFIDLPDIEVTPGTTDITLAIEVTHDPGDAIQFYSVDFLVTRIDAGSVLRFKDQADQDPAPSYANDAEYILNPVSTEITFLVDQFPPDESLLNVSDETNNFLNHELGATQTLLAILELELLVEPGIDPRGTFLIEVLDTTFFLEEDFGEVPWTSDAATLNVVPEPTTLGLTFAGVILVASLAWRRRARKDRTAAR